MADDGKVVIELIGKDNATKEFVRSFQEIQSGLKKVEEGGGAFDSLGTRAQAFASKWSNLITGMVAGLVSLGTIKRFFTTFFDFATSESNLAKLAVRLNTTTEDLSGLGLVARKSGMDWDSFLKAIERGQKNISAAALGIEQAEGAVDEMGEPLGKGSQALRELGLNAEKLNQLPLPQKLQELSRAFLDNIDPADRGRIALELFGRSGGGLVTALSAGPQAIQELIDRMERLGGVISTEGARKMAEAKEAAGDLTISWHNFSRELYENVAPAVAHTLNFLTDLIRARAEFARTDVELGPLGFLEPPGREAVGRFGEAAETFYGLMPTPPGLRQPPSRAKPGKAGAGGGLEAAQRQLESFINRMNLEMAKAMGDSMAAIEAWYQKESDTLANIESKTGESLAGRTSLQENYYSRIRKMSQDVDLYIAKESGDTYREIEAQANEWLAKAGGNFQQIMAIWEIKGKKEQEADRKQLADRLGMQKEYLDQLAQVSPELSLQLGYQRESLEIEKRLSYEKLAQFISDHHISQELSDQLYSQQALINQMKDYAQLRKDWEKQGFAGGVKIGVTDLEKTAETWGATQVADFLRNAPRDISTSMAQWFVDTLQHKKIDFEQLGWTMAQATIQKQLEGTLNELLPAGLRMVAKLLGIEIPAKQTAAEIAANTLAAGGAQAGANLIAGAEQAAAILAGRSGGGGLSFLSSIFGGEELSASEAYLNPYLEGIWAKGGVFRAFARGGLVRRPTLFPMAGGYGLMGEAGPEGILPLARLPGGDLGVKSAGAGPVEFKIIIQDATSRGVEVSGRQTGERELTLRLEEIVTGFVNNGGPVSTAILSLTGTRNRPIGRS